MWAFLGEAASMTDVTLRSLMLHTASRFPANVVQGFSTREGGVSQGRYSSLNLSYGWGDRRQDVDENLRRFAFALDFDPAEILAPVQVHGNRVVRAVQSDASTPADGIWAHRDDRGARVVAVRSADCVPILLASEDGMFVAAIHSGWRGTVHNIVGQAVAAMREHGARPISLRAAIGPCIEAKAFEVGPEVAVQFPGSFVQSGAKGRPHVDLVACVRRQLVESGIKATSIERVGGCTHSNPQLYFSYRRDGRVIGQHLAIVGFR
jgi:YfiH family protein